ncbi:MAG: flagellar hook-associated protein FlgK [Cellulosilyticaceae bacterium]
MGSAFFEFNIAQTGLFAAQRGLAVTGNNITNATTPGYSRQVLHQKASFPMSGYGNGMLGTGVETIQIQRVRNSYLDNKLWAQNDTLGEYRVKTQQNALVESVFGEPSDAGFTKIFNDFYEAIDNLAKLPTEGERKEALRQTLTTFSKYYNSAAQSLSEFQKDLNFEVSAMVDEINMLTTRIQSLNQQIYQSEMHGDYANTLRDDRELCIDRLSQLINIEAEEVEIVRADGKVDLQYRVKANGQLLVDHFDARLLDVKPRTEADKMNKEDVSGLYDVVWQDGLPFDMYNTLSGELKGAIDMRDGSGSDAENIDKENTYRGIPYYIKKMDQFVSGFANNLNSIYNKDVDGNQIALEGVEIDGAKIPKYTLFGAVQVGGKVPLDFTDPEVVKKYIKYDENGKAMQDENGFVIFDIPAKEFSLSAEVYSSADNIRTNFEHETYGKDDVNPNPGSNDLLLELLGSKSDSHMFDEGDPKDFMISMFSELGINAKEAKMYETSQTNITNVIKNQRMSVSQVDMNEEFMNLVKYNQAYQVAAKMMSTIDGIYETTIYKLGG